MAKWGIQGTKGAANVQSVLLVNAAAASPCRIKVTEFSIGSNATPADSAFVWVLQRSTTAGTGNALTPNAFDPADTLAAITVCKDTVTADPTLTAAAFLWGVPLNQKASFRWVADQDGGVVIPATANAGLMLGLSAATTTTFGGSVGFVEQ